VAALVHRTGVLLVGVHLYLTVSSFLVAVAFSSTSRSSGYMSSSTTSQELRLARGGLA
jgi:hypothetical protein